MNRDICILGGSLAGLVFARLLLQQQPTLALTVIDDSGSDASGKSIVIDRPAADCLRGLDALPPSSRPINQVQVSFAGVAQKTIGDGRQPLGYAIAPQQVQSALVQDVEMHNARLQTIALTQDGIDLTTNNGSIKTRLLVIACPYSALPPPFVTRRLPYQQTVLSLTATAALPPATARQRFALRRVLVLVPRPDDDGIGVIIVSAAAAAGSISALADKELSSYLSNEFGIAISVHGRRFAYKPQLLHTSPLAAPPILLLGSGATTLHPIGAQAISLAIADAKQLAAVFAAHKALPPPPAYAPYQRRRSAHQQKALLTSTLALAAFGAGGLF